MQPKVISTPSKYSFAGNAQDIVISASSAIDFRLYRDSSTLVLNENYQPIEGVVRIPLRSFMESEVQGAPLRQYNTDKMPVDKFHYRINDVPYEMFYIFPGGVLGNVDAESFVRKNFLTWQPQIKHISRDAPEWIRYVSLEDSYLFVKGYFESGSSFTRLPVLSSSYVHTIDVSYTRIKNLLGKDPLHYEIWVADSLGNPLSYTQRYIPINRRTINEDLFVFENSLGGFDTICFDGESKESADLRNDTSLIDNTVTEFGREYSRSWLKQTGYIKSSDHKEWVEEFFKSKCRYRVRGDSLERIYITKPKIEYLRGDVNGYEFTYSLAKNSIYINRKRGSEGEGTIRLPRIEAELIFDIKQ